MEIDKGVENVEPQLGQDQLSRMGELLIANATMTASDVERVLDLQKDKNILFGEAAKQLGLIGDSDVSKVLAEQYDYPYYHETSKQLSQSLIAVHSPSHPMVEKLRSLRGQLMLRWFEQGHKTLAITSTNTQDGANILVANLAVVFSQLGKKTLLIDANLRDPKQHETFNLDTRVGLSNILANRKGSYELSKHESLPKLSVLTAGSEVPNPQEILTKPTFSNLLKDLEKVYEVILIDTSPAIFGADYLTVAMKAGGVVIVARKDYTNASELKVLSNNLGVTNAQLVGSVVQEL